MRRPQLMAAVLTIVAGTGALVAAQQPDQAWLLLTTGERVDGAVSAAGARGQTTVDRSGFVVDEGGGRTTRIPFAQVALIDFTSGQRPTATELMALPATGHLLVMTNGTTRPGRLLDFTGNVVRWQPVRGQTFNLPMREVHRIYLNLNRSYELAQGGTWGQRRGFGIGRRGAGNDDAPRGGGGGSSFIDGGDAVEIAVLANRPWTDSGMTVRVGQMVRFEAQGRVLFSAQNVTGPDGAYDGGPRFPVPALGVGGLMGKVGPTGRAFRIGSSREPIRMPASGRLMLGVNDDIYEDNSGAFQVNIRRND